jgi:hypothetical protein
MNLESSLNEPLVTGVEPVDEILTGVRKGKGSRDGFMDWWIHGLVD